MDDKHQSDLWRRSGQTPVGAKVHPVDWAIESGAVDDVLHEMNSQLRRRHRRRMSVVTGAAVVLLFSSFMWHQANQQQTATGRTTAPSAVVSLPERQLLSDGSVVELRSGTQIAVAYTDSLRRVVLTRGAAHFQVAKRAQPFVVAVGDLEVRAVGTAFSVQLGRAEVEVMVTEGSVAVDQVPAGSDAPAVTTLPDSISPRAIVALVKAGNRAVVPTGAISASHSRLEVMPFETAELAARLAWRVPRLEFSRTPLVEALAMMNQHADAGKKMTVVLGDPSLERVQVSGVLRADNMETLLRLLDEEHGVKAEHRSPNEVVLRKRR